MQIAVAHDATKPGPVAKEVDYIIDDANPAPSSHDELTTTQPPEPREVCDNP